jgi:tetratricopeptide (TPR) repeat protein
LKSQRRLYHQQAAEWLIKFSDRRVEEYAGLIAHHFERAGQETTAAGWYARAGKQAEETYVTDIALSYYQQALALYERSEEQVPAAELLPVYMGLGNILREKAQFTDALNYFMLMRETAEDAWSLPDRVQALNGLARVYERLGDYQSALAYAEEMGICVEQMDEPDPLLRFQAVFRKGWTLYRMGETAEALVIARQSLVLSSEANYQRGLAQSLSFLASVYVMLGQFAEAFAALVAEKMIERIRWWEHYCAINGGSMDNNPSPGNKAGGLTTILEK